jgi:hypothetical protein
MASFKEQIDKIKETLKKDDENVEIKLYESGDTLLIPETSAAEGISGGDGNSYTVKGGGGKPLSGSGGYRGGKDYGTGSSTGGQEDGESEDGEQPKIDGHGSGQDGDGDGDGGQDGDGDGDGDG